MPGGFTSGFGGGRDGYQNVDDSPAPKPSLSVPPQPVPQPAQPQTAPGAYQTV